MPVYPLDIASPARYNATDRILLSPVCAAPSEGSMLRSLSIRNFAIIDRLDLEFGPGFNVLTGETGAGKSIIMDALNLILGGRADSEMVRGGAKNASIDAAFDVGGSPELLAVVAEMGLETEDDLLLLSRDVAANGKSAARVAGRPATIAQLREIGDWLVDLHGQHEHQSLLAAPRHIDILDDWGGKALEGLRAETAAAYQQTGRRSNANAPDWKPTPANAPACSTSISFRPRKSPTRNFPKAKTKNWKPNIAVWRTRRNWRNRRALRQLR